MRKCRPSIIYLYRPDIKDQFLRKLGNAWKSDDVALSSPCCGALYVSTGESKRQLKSIKTNRIIKEPTSSVIRERRVCELEHDN